MKATCRFDLARRAAALVALVVWWGAAGSAWSAAYRILDLGTLGGGMSYASGINDSGQVVGCAWTASGDLHAFRTAPNQPIDPATDDLGTFGGGVSLAFGINDSGQVVGQAWNEFGYQVFRTAPNQPINPATDDLGPALYVYGINNSGQVVGSNFSHDQGGWGEPPDPRLFAWVYSGNGPMQYLNELIDPASGWVLHEPRDINDLGQIVGWGLHNGNERAFLLTPIPEPASLVMLGGCLVGLSLLRRRRCCAA